MMRVWTPMVCTMVLTGCTTTMGRLPSASVAAADGYKMIRPGAVANACRVQWLGSGADDADGLLGDALAQFESVDPEVESVRDARVAVQSWNLGVVRRDCVEVTADLVRSVPVLVVDRHHAGE